MLLSMWLDLDASSRYLAPKNLVLIMLRAISGRRHCIRAVLSRACGSEGVDWPFAEVSALAEDLESNDRQVDEDHGDEQSCESPANIGVPLVDYELIDVPAHLEQQVNQEC